MEGERPSLEEIKRQREEKKARKQQRKQGTLADGVSCIPAFGDVYERV